MLTYGIYRAGHYGRALEDAISSHKNQWPSKWEGKNPLSGGKTFNSMDPTERVRMAFSAAGGLFADFSIAQSSAHAHSVVLVVVRDSQGPH